MEFRNDNYDLALKALECGQLSNAATLSSKFRDSFEQDERILHSLINRRLQFKTGNFECDELLELPKSPRLRAEYFFVLGLSAFNTTNWSKGSEFFLKAKVHYAECQLTERSLLCAYNALIGTINNSSYEPEDLIADLNKLSIECKTANAHKILGLVNRQLAYEYIDLKRFHAAKKFAQMSEESLVSNAPKSDRDLSLLALAIALLNTNQESEALASLEEVINPVEPRVEWPLAVTEYLLGRNKQRPNKKNYDFIDPFFESVLDQDSAVESDYEFSGVHWNFESGQFIDPQNKFLFKVRTSSLEYKLLSLLKEKSKSRNFLIECLYPGSENNSLVNNRLHRLVSRINKRLDNMIDYKSGMYSLNPRIVRIKN